MVICVYVLREALVYARAINNIIGYRLQEWHEHLYSNNRGVLEGCQKVRPPFVSIPFTLGVLVLDGCWCCYPLLLQRWDANTGLQC